MGLAWGGVSRREQVGRGICHSIYRQRLSNETTWLQIVEEVLTGPGTPKHRISLCWKIVHHIVVLMQNSSTQGLAHLKYSKLAS